MSEPVHAPMEMIHREIVDDIVSAIDCTLYGASIADVKYSEIATPDGDIVSGLSIESTTGNNANSNAVNLDEYEFVDWVMHRFLRFMRENSL